MSTILLIISALIHQIEGVSIKKYNAKHTKGGFIFTAIVSLFSMLFFVITANDGLDFSIKIIPYAILAGIFYSSASFLTFVAYGCGSYVMSSLILSYSLVLTICYGVFILKEDISVFTYVGFVIMLISLYLSRGTKEEEGIQFSAKWLVCIVLSAICAGMFGITQRTQQIIFNNSSTNEFMIIALGFSAISLFILGIIKDAKNLGYIFKKGIPYAGLAGLANGATNSLLLFVYTLIPISIASPTNAGIKIIVSFILSKLIFKEKFVKRQVISVLLGAVALVLLNL